MEASMTRKNRPRIQVRRARRDRGRPREDAADQLVVDMAAALKATFSLGRQQARDQALAWLEGQQASPTKLPRGARRRAAPHSDLVGYELPKSFEGRTETILGKNLKPRPDVVSALSELLRAVVTKDMAAIVRAFSHLKRAR
jgi:hypothetical protein